MSVTITFENAEFMALFGYVKDKYDNMSENVQKYQKDNEYGLSNNIEDYIVNDVYNKVASRMGYNHTILGD
tara:strand:+ start:5332 stop:5544 length:213 start_codon:yes stop_codon:yes gene_type:complete